MSRHPPRAFGACQAQTWMTVPTGGRRKRTKSMLSTRLTVSTYNGLASTYMCRSGDIASKGGEWELNKAQSTCVAYAVRSSLRQALNLMNFCYHGRNADILGSYQISAKQYYWSPFEGMGEDEEDLEEAEEDPNAEVCAVLRKWGSKKPRNACLARHAWEALARIAGRKEPERSDGTLNMTWQEDLERFLPHCIWSLKGNKWSKIKTHLACADQDLNNVAPPASGVWSMSGANMDDSADWWSEKKNKKYAINKTYSVDVQWSGEHIHVPEWRHSQQGRRVGTQQSTKHLCGICGA
mmetsp:Transcript_130396/g.254023  ORF Transcript_130396/g.254023 Transcript_130396/m.254023 type:complete len:295 (+) Transcript_130396:408-1292(+)